MVQPYLDQASTTNKRLFDLYLKKHTTWQNDHLNLYTKSLTISGKIISKYNLKIKLRIFFNQGLNNLTFYGTILFLNFTLNSFTYISLRIHLIQKLTYAIASVLQIPIQYSVQSLVFFDLFQTLLIKSWIKFLLQFLEAKWVI